MDHMYASFYKLAEEMVEKREHPALTAAKGIGGFALGAGLGYGAAHGVDQGMKAFGHRGLPAGVIRYGAPAVAAASGLGFNYLQGRMMDRIKANMSPEVPGAVPEEPSE